MPPRAIVTIRSLGAEPAVDARPRTGTGARWPYRSRGMGWRRRAVRDPVSRLSTSLSGCAVLKSASETIWAGRNVRLVPVSVADQRLPGGLLPPRFGLAVVHHEVAEAEVAGRPEVVQRAVHGALEDERRVAQRAEGHDDRHATQRVIGDLVPDQDGQRIGPRLAVDDQRDDRRIGRQPRLGVRDGFELRVVDRRDAVLGRTATGEFAEVDRGDREVGRPAFESRRAGR